MRFLVIAHFFIHFRLCKVGVPGGKTLFTNIFSTNFLLDYLSLLVFTPVYSYTFIFYFPKGAKLYWQNRWIGHGRISSLDPPL